MRHIYVNDPSRPESLPSITDALKAVPKENREPVTIHIAPGVYRERLEIRQPFITLLGEHAENTVIVYGLGAFERMPEGRKRGTFRTYSVLVDTHDFTARNITFQNDAGFGQDVGQAIALYVDGDRCAFYDCRMVSSQDTLFTGPLPPKEIIPGGFIGPKQFAPRINGRQYYKNCYIRGDVDFVFGSATAYFDRCEFFSQRTPKYTPEGTKDQVYGYVTAASTPKEQEYGYILNRCRFTSDCPEQSVYLGRPWRQYAHTVLLHCELGAHIRQDGWHSWEKPKKDIRYEEYESFGAGITADTKQKRVGFSKQLTAAEADHYQLKNVLGDWDV